MRIAGGVVVSALLIQAREFQVVDGNGVHVTMDGAGIQFYDAEGTGRSIMTATAIEYRDEHFTLRASIGSAVVVYDEKGQEIWRMPPR